MNLWHDPWPCSSLCWEGDGVWGDGMELPESGTSTPTAQASGSLEDLEDLEAQFSLRCREGGGSALVSVGIPGLQNGMFSFKAHPLKKLFPLCYLFKRGFHMCL